MKVYELTSLVIDCEDVSYPVQLAEESYHILFSSLEAAEAEMANLIKEQHPEYPNLFYTVVTRGVDEEVEWELRCYDKNGKYLTNDIHGQEPMKQEAKFTPGTIVQFVKGNCLNLGVVYAAPQIGQESAYLIDELEGEHDHIPEELISFPFYNLTPPQAQAYETLRVDVLSRLSRNDRSGPVYIPKV